MGVPHIRAFLFDLDGVLIDVARVYDEVAEEFFGIQMMDRVRYLHLVDGKPFTEWVRAVGDARGVSVTPHLLQQVQDEIEWRLGTACRPVPRVLRALRTWAGEGYRLGVVTNNNEPITMVALSYAHLRSLLNTVVCGEDTSTPKPSPTPWLVAAGRLGVSPSECLAIDDHPRYLQGPATVGMATLCVSHRDFSQEVVEAALQEIG